MTEILDDTKGLIPIVKKDNHQIVFGILAVFLAVINFAILAIINYAQLDWLGVVLYFITYAVTVIPLMFSLYMIFILLFSLTALILTKLRLKKLSSPFKYLVEKADFIVFFLFSELIMSFILGYIVFSTL